MQDHVYVAQHCYELGLCDEVKMIGVYSSRRRAEAAGAKLKLAEGFGDHPDGFSIDRYEVNRDHWTGGFVTCTYPTNQISDA